MRKTPARTLKEEASPFAQPLPETPRLQSGADAEVRRRAPPHRSWHASAEMGALCGRERHQLSAHLNSGYLASSGAISLFRSLERADAELSLERDGQRSSGTAGIRKLPD